MKKILFLSLILIGCWAFAAKESGIKQIDSFEPTLRIAESNNNYTFKIIVIEYNGYKYFVNSRGGIIKAE